MKHLPSGQTGTHRGVSGSVHRFPFYPILTDLFAILQQPGDFGTVIKSTGELVVEGNIYDHEDLAQIAQKHPPCEAHEIDRYHIHSYEVRGVDVAAGLGT